MLVEVVTPSMSRLAPREMNDPHRQDVLNKHEWRLRIGETGLQYLRCDVKRLRWQFGEVRCLKLG